MRNGLRATANAGVPRPANVPEELMKLLHMLIVVAAAGLLTACNFTLASDITPPPDYVSPTAMPTLGALVPPLRPTFSKGLRSSPRIA